MNARAGTVVLGLLVCGGCREEKAAPPLSSLSPAPLPAVPAPRLDVGPDAGTDEQREALFRVAPAPVFGEPIPKDAARINLEGGTAKFAGKSYAVDKQEERVALLAAAGARVLLIPDMDTYLAQAAPLLAALDDARVETWLEHPAAAVTYRVVLRDEPAFNAWLEEPKPGKVRIVQRADGLELVTNIGKVPGGDPNGPSIPLRGGVLDVAAERAGLERIQQRFEAPDICVLASFGTELAKVADVLSGTYRAAGEGIFAARCVVYPRPRK